VAFGHRFYIVDRLFRDLSSSQQILAAMHSIAANNSAGGTYCEADGCVDTPAGILHHASRFILPVASYASDRYVLSPAQIENQRDRSVLAELIASVEPNQSIRLADALLSEFGSIGRILSEPKEALQRVIGQQKAVVQLLTAAKSLLMANLENEVPKQLVSATDEKLIRYLKAGMGALAVETMRVLFLNNANYLVGDQEFGTASPRKILVQPRSILKRALELNASAIILVHNHPSGETRPSKSDIKFTLSIKVLCRELEITLHDHIIIAGKGWSSFRKMKII